MSGIELKPCPFCGGAMQVRYALWASEGDRDAVIHATPTNCPVEGCFSIDTFDNGVSVSEAWNRRAEARQAPQLTEGLITAVQGLLAHWDRHDGPEKRGEYDGVVYWSPAGRMVDTQFIADLRAALEAAFAARPAEIRYVAVDHTGCIYTCEDEEQAIKIAKDIRDDRLATRPAGLVAVKGLVERLRPLVRRNEDGSFVVLRDADLSSLLDWAEALTQAAAPDMEPFGYWCECKWADPALLRKPAYIPPTDALHMTTPLYSAAQLSALQERAERAERERDAALRIKEMSSKALAFEKQLVRADAAKAHVAELEKERDKAWRIATDQRYMKEAYWTMLGPIGLKVADMWFKKGILRVHHSWGPEAAALSGEGRAQIILDMEEASKNAVPVENIDGDRPARAALAHKGEGR